MAAVGSVDAVLESCQKISSNSTQRARTLIRYNTTCDENCNVVCSCDHTCDGGLLSAGSAPGMHAKLDHSASLLLCPAPQRYASRMECLWIVLTDHTSFCVSVLSLQDQYLLRASVRDPAGTKQVVIKSASRSRRGKGRQSPPKELPDTLPAEESTEGQEAAPLTAAQHAKFADRLQDAQRVEDLFEVCDISPTDACVWPDSAVLVASLSLQCCHTRMLY